MFKQTIKNVLIIIILNSVNAQDIKDMDFENLLKLARDISDIHVQPFQPSDVAFILITRNNTELNHLNGTKPTKILIHGWLENHKRSWYNSITHEYLIQNDYNVVQTDWERVARTPYVNAAEYAQLIGQTIATFIQTHNIQLGTTHLIGHSLGAQIAGATGKSIKQQTGKRIHRITALDPAGPYFRESALKLQLDDAAIVDVIHTDGGVYGYERPTGTLDIYVNGGVRQQPGCLDIRQSNISEIVAATFCSHARSHQYFIESINQGYFECRQCTSYLLYILKQCDMNVIYNITAESVTDRMVGSCFTETHKDRPYLSNK